jgi:hypothetical protein
MITGPPGEPSAKANLPSRVKAMVGAIALIGRLPGAGALATGLPSRTASKREIGELVVEEEALGHHLRAEDEFDRGGHRDDFAAVVDHREMARAVALRRALRRIIESACFIGGSPACAVPMSCAGSISMAR